MTTQPGILIIGSGIAGLATGCYAQMNGYQSQIIEMNPSPGGLCTAWQRGDYLFDGCIHYLFGSAPGQPFNQLWQELGAVQKRTFVNHDEFMRVTEPGGKTLIAYSNPDRLAEHLKALSPQDGAAIEAFCAGVKTFKNFDLSIFQQKPKGLMGPGDWASLIKRLLPFARSLGRWGMLSLDDFITQFKDPFLRRALPQVFSWPDIPVMVAMTLLAYLDNQNAGYPVGASLQFARDIEQRYLDLGGTIRYGARVERILVEQGRAVGVGLEGGEEIRAERVISACDGRTTLFNLLDRQYLNRQLEQTYDGHLPTASLVQVALGVNRDFSDQPHWVTHLLDQPVVVAGEERHEIGVKHYSFDPSQAPAGKSVVMIILTTTYEAWHKTYGNTLLNAHELPEVERLLGCLDQIYPGIRADIEQIDVVTPLSYAHHTGNWQGASSGWLLNKETLPQMVKGLPRSVSGVRQFYMVGQWTELGGGLPVVAQAGRNLIQQICHEDRRQFVAAIATP